MSAVYYVGSMYAHKVAIIENWLPLRNGGLGAMLVAGGVYPHLRVVALDKCNVAHLKTYAVAVGDKINGLRM